LAEHVPLSAKLRSRPTGFPETKMSDTDLRKELNEQQTEPLLPIEKKLILGSLITGLVLLAVLVVVNLFLGS
jgi:hypothetical protein